MKVISFGAGVSSDVSDASSADAMKGVNGQLFQNANKGEFVSAGWSTRYPVSLCWVFGSTVRSRWLVRYVDHRVVYCF